MNGIGDVLTPVPESSVLMIQVIFLLNLAVSNRHVKEVIPGTLASDLGIFSRCSFSVTVSSSITVGAVHNIEHHMMIS